MQMLRDRRPSPALVIAVIALFVALAGSAYAANKIGTKEIKANAITTGKIKKNAITTGKIKKNAVTGAKINEGTLGTVPSATNATNAETAKNFSRYFTSGLKKASVGQNVVLLTVGPFTFTGKCVDNGGGEFQSAIYLTTSAAGSFVYTYEHSGYTEADFNPGTEAQVDYGVSDTTPEWGAYSGYYSSFAAASPDGSVLLDGWANSGVHVFGADCAFEVTATNGA